MKNSIVQISDAASGFLGTGFVIDCVDDGVYVVTSGHVIARTENVTVNGKVATVIKNEYEEGLDLGLLHVKDMQLTALRISSESGSSLKANVIGFSLFADKIKQEPINNISVKHEVTLSDRRRTEAINCIKLSPDEEISHGYSGSPVICSTSNSVIGVVCFQSGPTANYAISAVHIHGLYEGLSSESMGAVEEKATYKKVELTTQLSDEEEQVLTHYFE